MSTRAVATSSVPDTGGQGLPKTISVACDEMWSGANAAFALCSELSQGARLALDRHGSAELKSRYLGKLVSGEWTGTMCLTEPQAGSDLAALTTRAEPQADGSYLLTGRKIYITWGDHPMTPNIVHLVLARLPGAHARHHRCRPGRSVWCCPTAHIRQLAGNGWLGFHETTYN